MNAVPKCNTCPPRADDAAHLIESARANRRSMFDYFHFSIARTSFSSGQNQQLVVPTYPDSYFVVKKLVASSSNGTFTTQIKNGSTGRVLNDIKVNNANLFGTIQLPNNLLDPIVFPPSSNVVLDITDTSGGTNIIQAVMVGYRHYNLARPPQFGKGGATLVWYQYSATFTSLGANASGTTNIRIDADADFLVRKLVSTQTGNYTLKISDSGSQDAWFDQAQQNANASGTAQYPNVLAKPRLVKRNSTISVDVQDLSGSTNTIQLILEGAKVYR